MMTEVAADVFAFIQPDGGWCLSNAGLVGGSLVIDTAATAARARRLRSEIDRIGGTPRILLNTHHHGDHVFGNQFFPSATIVAHTSQRTEMIESGFGLTRLWPDVDWGELRLVPPELTFDDAITVHAGDIRAELFHVGPAHTTNDVVAWIPSRGVLFCGDVALAGATPFCLMGSIAGSLAAVHRLRALGATIVVPGHGPVSGPSILDDTERYLTWLQDLARRGSAAGLSPLDTARSASLDGFADWLDSERLVGNLHRAYAELAGSPLGSPVDVLTGFQEMAVYNGGLPTCHA